MEFWTMSNGEIIEVTKMETKHIENVINYLENKSYITKKDEEWLDIFESELKRRNK